MSSSDTVRIVTSPGSARRRRLKWLIGLSTALSLALPMALRYSDLSSRRERNLASGDRQARSLAHILSRYVAEVLASSDAALRQLAAHAAHNGHLGGAWGAQAAWSPLLLAARAGLTGTGSISVLDKDGVVRQSTQAASVGESRSGDYVFRQLTAGAIPGLTLGPPYWAQDGPNRQLLLTLGRRLVGPRGEFDGAVVATFMPGSLRELLRTVDTGRDGVVAVFHADGFELVREPSARNAIGNRAATDPVLEFGRRTGGGSFRTEGAATHPALRHGIASLPGLPILVVVSLSEPELLAAVEHDAMTSAVLLSALAAFAVAGLIVVFRQMDRRAVVAAAAERSQHLEVLGRLTGGVAHDFNNLLAVIQGYASLIVIDPRSPTYTEDQESLREIRTAATRAAGLTNQLLAFARRQPLQPRLVSISALVTNMKPMLERTVGEDVNLRLDVKDACVAMVDPVQFDTALLNLVVNARHAMPKGGPLVIEVARVKLDARYARANPDATPGDFCCLTVSDTGTGISAEVISQIFEPFFTTKPPGEGTGLGLSMVYGFVRQSGGHAKVYSELGHGTTVKLYFPAAGDQAESGTQPPLAQAPRGAGETVLLVEDDKALRRSATRSLEALGYRVITAEDGPSALVAARQEPAIHLLFTDVVLSGPISGLELAAELRRQRPTLPVLFTSGYSEEIIAHRTTAAKDLFLLPKPFNSDDLATALRRALEGRR